MIIYAGKDYYDVSRKAANIMSAQIIMKPRAVLGLATGSTPIGMYKQLIEWYKISALGGYNALAEAGLSIPEDISVMGYDGIYLSRVVKPSLVTYQQNTKALGRLAADKLIELIEHPRVTLPEQIRVSGKLLDGGSVRIL